MTKDVVVTIGTGSEVEFEAAGAQRIEITGARINTLIDTSSTETNSVFTYKELRALPVARNVDAVALLAPGVVKGDDFGRGLSLPSFGGASIGENGYYINGFDVTNIRNFTSYADLPFGAIAEQQVKTGGYGAEYGRSLGGVVSLVTQRGTNEWHGGGALFFEPNSLRSRGKDVEDLDFPGDYTLYRSHNVRNRFTAEIYAGGPIIEDKLFIFGLIELPYNTSTSYGSERSTTYKTNYPRGIIKLDFTPTDQHRFELTAISNRSVTKYSDYDNAPWDPSLSDFHGSGDLKSGGSVLIGKYTGYLTDNFTVSALVGRVYDQSEVATGSRLAGANCPYIYDPYHIYGDRDFPGCFDTNYITRPLAGSEVDSDTRKAFRLDLEYQLGDHTIRGGVDSQKFNSYAAGVEYSGGIYYRYYEGNGTRSINGVVLPDGTNAVRTRTYMTTSGSYDVENQAFYIEDSWRATNDVLLYGGLRWESFNNKTAAGESFVEAKNLLAPRFGVSWDVNGDSSLKVFANAGRYFIPVAANTNIRMSQGTYDHFIFNEYNGPVDPVTGAPTGPLGPQVGGIYNSDNLLLGDPRTFASTNLKPMNQDEFILGFQKAVLDSEWTFGAKAIYRKINDGMDDYCGTASLYKWAEDNGHPDAVFSDNCVLMNPGRDVTLMANLNGDGTLSQVTIPASYFGLPFYQRTYKAIELQLDRPMKDGWSMAASYTWSRNYGNAEGYVQSDLQQEDAGITQDFDFAAFTHGAYGALPNDRTHVIKLRGNYEVSSEFSVGANLTVASGRPISCNGNMPESDPDIDAAWAWSPSSYYCLGEPDANGVREPVLVPRGSVGRTPWTRTLDLQFAYKPQWADNRFTLAFDIFNVFNSQTVTAVNQTRDFSHLSGLYGDVSLNYLQPVAFQSPRSVRIMARYEF